MSCMRDGFIQGAILDGRFECVAPLNHGSFGMVFLAKDMSNNGEFVAVKCILKQPANTAVPENLGDDHLIELICHDRLEYHPNIVNLVHAFETDAHMYLVLEYASNGDLYEAIRLGRGPLETSHVKNFMLELVNAVEFMHSKGLYHRDIKPENIFLAQDGSLKLGDFGLSTTEAWTLEACVGSDRYMAPEQFDPADSGYSPAQADIWAVGICLLNILFSRNPFVTPSESDILFTDYVRDKQSLFDIFPSMSQDTFEVLVNALAIDPTKRSLVAMRAALERVIAFTTDDDLFDDFCTDDHTVVPASANRMPLRTPSIQTPAIEGASAFPWAKVLPLNSPRQLSTVPDDEDLFPEEKTSTKTSWYHVPDTPSMASVIDSALGASIQSMKLREPKPRSTRTGQLSVAGSLPVNVSKPAKATATFSKSWSDLWDEEEEELEDARRRFNSRNWSSESLDEDVTVRPSLAEVKDVNSRNRSPGDDRSVMDKWSALGNRRRAVTVEQEDKTEQSRKRTNTGNWRRGFGFGGMKVFSKDKDVGAGKVLGAAYGTGVGERKTNRSRNKARLPGEALRSNNWRKDAHPVSGDEAEWVGGWSALHA